ncbi:TPA: hypothetical protein N0F65_008817 [Lagenidium giganteum]|uniref:Condensation domain-containing protein n=1 Tax=Lagenidium giganteum TaxID=4803 RepID=A0AAV2YZJ7_9STRA|nr:TPA: hypothetical protein N0F65_008817 [Lagenidium giganteum]
MHYMLTQSVKLHGFERFVTIVPQGSMKIAHVMQLSGDIAVLRERIHDAVLFTANKHPRLRGKLSKTAFAAVDVMPALTLHDVQDLVRFTDFQTSTEWQTFVQTECDVQFDRYTQFPFFVVVATESGVADQAKLLLFTDHYLSDGKSGMVVLNDIVSQVANPSPEQPTEMPLYASLYELWWSGSKWRRSFAEWLMRRVSSMVIKPPPSKGGLHLPRASTPVNESCALFCAGTVINQKAALQKCRDERVTFFGAMVAATVVSYYNAARHNTPAAISEDGRFRLLMEVDFNMRQRLSTPLDDDTIGMYAMMATLDKLAHKGINMKTTSFWDLARLAKKETDKLAKSVDLNIPLLFVDQNIHAGMTNSELDRFSQRVVTTEVNLSNIGKYAFATKHHICNPSQNEAMTTLSINNLWVFNNLPSLCAGGVFFVTSVNGFNYSFSHKYESETAQVLFSMFVECIESLGKKRVTFFGAMVAATVVSYYNAARQSNSAHQQKIGKDGRFRLLMEVDFNMRQRLSKPLDENTVGLYISTATLEKLAHDGIDMKSTSFWDFARLAKKETDKLISSLGINFPLLFLDQKLRAGMTKSELDRFSQQSVSTEVNLSNIGKYTFATKHHVSNPSASSSRSTTTLSIDNLWVFNNLPSLCAGGVFFVTSVNGFNYSFSHKYESETAQALFSTYVECIESLASVRAVVQTRAAPTMSDHAARATALRGYERLATMADHVGIEIAHAMLVRGDVAILHERLPAALLATANKHPRLRGRVSKDDFATLKVAPQLTLADITPVITSIHFKTPTDWQSFIASVCEKPNDRYDALPFRLVVAQEGDAPASASTVRLMLFTDLYLSDSYSGVAVLHELLQEIACPADHEVEELPLRASMYELYFRRRPWRRRWAEWLMCVLGKPWLRRQVEAFRPLLPIRQDQHDFTIPPVPSECAALFRQGRPETMRSALDRCRREGVTLTGALVAATIVAFYNANLVQGCNSTFKRFRVALDINVDMRRRIGSSVVEDVVGLYSIPAALRELHKQGVCVATALFWDVARRASTATDRLVRSLRPMLSVVTADQRLHARAQQRDLDLVVPFGVTRDTGLTNVGSYPFPTELAIISNPGVRSSSVINVEDLCVYHNLPVVGPGAMLFVTSVHSFQYALAHKFLHGAGDQLLSSFATCVESLGSLPASPVTMLQVANMIASPAKSQHATSANFAMAAT